MDAVIKWLEHVFQSIPLTLMEIWGRFGFLIGLVFMIAAFGGFTFKPGGRFGFGREKQNWDSKAFLSIVITFLLIDITGYIGSFIVLVPGAQTFESLKDLSVFLCVLLFGYPALIVVPIAYGISDLIEGVPPGFLLDWWLGYLINPACFWVAYQLIGKNPDFKKLKTWGWYLLFVVIFMMIEPQLWGYICSGKFTSEISYRNITPALFFTTSITWILAPFAMMIALPLARKSKMFWAEIEGHVKERLIGHKEWIWQAGGDGPSVDLSNSSQGLPIRVFLITPFIILILAMVGATAFLTLRSSENAANMLAGRLHSEISENINLELDEYLDKFQGTNPFETNEINNLLRKLPISKHGQAFIVDQDKKIIASSLLNTEVNNSVQQSAIENLSQLIGGLNQLKTAKQFRFDIVKSKPLSRETWLTQATPYQDKRGGHQNWILMTSIPEAYYLEGVRTGNSQSAMVFAVALILSLIVVILLAAIVTNPIIRISKATQALASGDLTQQVPDSELEELGTLSTSFNYMAKQLQSSFDNLLSEVKTRKKRESELVQSETRAKESENRLQLAIRAANLGIWDWDIVNNKIIWDDSMFKQYGLTRSEINEINNYEGWSNTVIKEDFERTNKDIEDALKGVREFDSEFRVRWTDGSIHYIKGMAQTIRDEEGKPLRMVGINYDITKQKVTEQEIIQYRNHLEELVAERTSALASRTTQLELSNKELESFSYSVSHDLRAPLRGIDGWSLALLEDFGPQLDPKALSYLERVRSETQRMGELIDDLLKLSRITMTEMKWEKVDLSLIAEIVVKRLQEENKERVLNFTIQPNLVTEGDPHFLEIVLTNLLGNACKFTQRVDVAKIEFGKKSINGKDVYFVSDNGAGFNMNSAKKLFETFQRMHKQSEFSGTGVGLAMVKRIVNLHLGKVWAESRVNEGATFYFTINEQTLMSRDRGL